MKQRRRVKPIPMPQHMGPDPGYLENIRAQLAMMDTMPERLRRQIHEHGFKSAFEGQVHVARAKAVIQIKKKAARKDRPRFVAPKIGAGWNYG